MSFSVGALLRAAHRRRSGASNRCTLILENGTWQATNAPTTGQSAPKKKAHPARSVYKLEEIVRKFGLLKRLGERGPGGRASTEEASSRVSTEASPNLQEALSNEASGDESPGYASPPIPAILDVGAAPGSWSLWLLRQMKGQGRLVAVDIQDLGIAPSDSNFSFLKGSILDEPVRARLRERGPYNLVVSDAAPATTGSRLVDQARSEELVEAVMRLGARGAGAGGRAGDENLPGRRREAAHLRAAQALRAGARLQARSLPRRILRDLPRGDGVPGLTRIDRIFPSGRVPTADKFWRSTKSTDSTIPHSS